MKYTIVMFTSRTDTMRFYSLLKQFNGFCSIINTPHSLSRSCGISVKLGNNLIPVARQIINQNKFMSFKGIFEINLNNFQDTPHKIY
ncbi:MAG: DUF3343 domain-containing protein [Clostridia bacterium]